MRRTCLHSSICTSSITTEEGVVIGIDHTSGLPITLAPVTASAPDLGLRDVRMQIDLGHARPAITGITRAAMGVMNVPMSAVDTVQSGCDAMCWAANGTTLWVSARIATSQAFEFFGP